MCSEMSQYIPKTAVMSAAVATPAGRAAQPGRPLRRSANFAAFPRAATRPERVTRLRLIQELQADGLKLSAIKRVIGEHGAGADQFVGLRRVVTAPFETEASEILSTEELADRFGPVEPKVLEKAQKLGLL